MNGYLAGGIILVLLLVIARLVWAEWRRVDRARRWCAEAGHDVGRFYDGALHCARCGEELE